MQASVVAPYKSCVQPPSLLSLYEIYLSLSTSTTLCTFDFFMRTTTTVPSSYSTLSTSSPHLRARDIPMPTLV